MRSPTSNRAPSACQSSSRFDRHPSQGPSMSSYAVEFDAERIDTLFEEVNQSHLPGAAVGIAINGRPVYRKGFGLASIELPLVLSPSTRMRIGSTTKHFAALLYMLLCEEGLASPEDPLGKHMPQLNPVAQRVTARQLMTNTNGLRDACDLRFQFSGTTGQRTTRDELVALYRDLDDVNTAPGSHWIYNNGGWVLLTALIERITGKCFEDIMAERLFQPLGMHDSLVRSWDTDFVPNSATSHSINRAGRLERLFWHQDFGGAGTVMSTIDDMLRWADNISRHRIGSERTWSMMMQPQMLPNGVSTTYGFGLFEGLYRGVRVIHHPGGYTGAGSQMLKVPEAGLDVVVLSNTDSVNCTAVVYRIVDALLPRLEPLKIISRAPATGTFRSATTGCIVELLDREGQPCVAIDGSLDFPYQWSDARLQEARIRPLIGKIETPVDGDAGLALPIQEFHDAPGRGRTEGTGGGRARNDLEWLKSREQRVDDTVDHSRAIDAIGITQHHHIEAGLRHFEHLRAGPGVPAWMMNYPNAPIKTFEKSKSIGGGYPVGQHLRLHHHRPGALRADSVPADVIGPTQHVINGRHDCAGTAEILMPKQSLQATRAVDGM